MNVNDRRHDNLKQMCDAASDVLYEGAKSNDRNTQLKWKTVVNALRKKLNKEADATTENNNNNNNAENNNSTENNNNNNGENT